MRCQISPELARIYTSFSLLPYEQFISLVLMSFLCFCFRLYICLTAATYSVPTGLCTWSAKPAET